MTTFILMSIGTACLLLSEAYIPWKTQWRLMKKTPAAAFREFRDGTVPRRPMWSRALSVLGFGLFILAVWRQLRGL